MPSPKPAPLRLSEIAPVRPTPSNDNARVRVYGAPSVTLSPELDAWLEAHRGRR